MNQRTTRIQRHLPAPPDVVYAALTTADSVRAWRFPDGMTIEIHEFDAREGGRFRVSLTYEDAASAGKTSAHTDTYHGHFLRLRPERQVVEVLEFETSDPAAAGEMKITYDLAASGGGTDLVAIHENVPPGVSLEDNQQGWSMALDRLAALVAGDA